MAYLVKEVVRNGCFGSDGEENSISYILGHTVWISVLVIVLLVLFCALCTCGGILFLASLQWFMDTEFYLDIVVSVAVWMWAVGMPCVMTFPVFWANVA